MGCDSSDGVTEWQAWQPFLLSAVPSRLWRHQRLHMFSPWSANQHANPGFWPTLPAGFCALFILLCFQCTELQHDPNFCITLLACNTVLLFQCLTPWSARWSSCSMGVWQGWGADGHKSTVRFSENCLCTGGTFVSDAEGWLHLVTAKGEGRWGYNWFPLQDTHPFILPNL